MKCICFLIFCSTVTAATANNWPAWRGPAMTGVTTEKDLPEHWSKTDNVRWRAELPGPGNSSPIVWEDRVFVSQAVTKENRRTLMCFERQTGKVLWQSGVTYSENEPTQESNPYCSGSPVTDGERVYVCFGSAGVFAYDYEGKEVWRRDLGKVEHMFGNAISPVLAGDRLFLNYGPDAKARLVALDKKTGNVLWEVQPPQPDPSELPSFGPGGGGGPGGFGPGMMVAPQMLAQGDKDGNQALSGEEFSSLADSWFDKLDPEKSGKLTVEQFADKFGELLPRRDEGPGGGGPPGGGEGRGRRGTGPGRFVGGGLFAAADVDKDGTLTRPELKQTFAKWSSEWDSSKQGSLSEAQLRAGLDGALPRPNFGGPGGPGGRGPGGRGGSSWSTPLVINAGNREELVLSTAGRLAAYEPATGKLLWMSKGLGGNIYTSPVWGEGVVFATTSGPGGGAAIAVKPAGDGDVTESHRVWKLDRTKSQIGSGVIHEGHLYTVSQEGIAQCMDLKNGETLWEERLQGSSARGGSWSSMLLSEGKIYVPSQSGDVFVIRASPKFELIATNSVGEPTNASLAASNGELYLRTAQSLWCFKTRP